MPLGDFAIDLSKPPYEVPCPVCLAFALEPCRSEQKVLRQFGVRLTGAWPAKAAVLEVPHAERREHWERHPEYRVKVMP